ncbi:MAG: thioredoxin [Roseiflexaceae bacterium]
MAEPITVTDADFARQVLRSALPVAVDFWAPWCPPCRAIAPILKELASEYADTLVIAKLNIDENPQYFSQLGIRGAPTLIIFKDGVEVDRLLGAMPKARYRARFDAVLQLAGAA